MSATGVASPKHTNQPHGEHQHLFVLLAGGRRRTNPCAGLGIFPISSPLDILHSAREAMNRDSLAPDQNAKAGSGSNKNR